MKNMNEKIAFPIALLIAALTVYAISQPGLTPVRLFSKSFAAAGTVLLAASLGVAGLALIWPKARNLVQHRKFWGLTGFGFAALHAVLAFHDPLLQSVEIALSRQNVRLGLMALVVFALLAATSNRISQKILGKNWKALQRAGFVGLFLVWADLLVLADGSFVKTPIGAFLFLTVTLGLALGIRGWFSGKTREN